jgi:pSer/pThr/pTyr-binding forkhead associated (FHA) protein
VHEVNSIDMRTAAGTQTAVAHLRDGSGRTHPLLAASTRIGRLPDNEIVLDDRNVSRH